MTSHAERIVQAQQESAEEREAVLQPLIRGERILRQLAIAAVLVLMFFMAVVGGIAYDTSQEVIKLGEQNKALNEASKLNSELNKQGLELLKSCVVPEDPGNCYENGQAGTGNAVLSIVCYNYATNKELIVAAIGGREINSTPPPGCAEFFEAEKAAGHIAEIP